MKRLILLAAAALAIASGASAAERTKFEFWYGLTGDLGEVMQKHCQLFNESQDKYEAVCTGQGGYDKAEQNTIAAYRAKQQPTIVQIYDAGTVNFMLSGAIYPADKFDKDFGLNVDWKGYFPGIANYYATSTGEMWSFPYNSSTAVFYWNKDAWAKIGKTEAPKTWAEFGEDLKAHEGRRRRMRLCLRFRHLAEPRAVLGDQQHADRHAGQRLWRPRRRARLQQDRLRRPHEGLQGLDRRRLRQDPDDAGRQELWSRLSPTAAAPRPPRRSPTTAPSRTRRCPSLNWDVAMLPVIDASKRTNSLVGGASLWIMEGKSKEEYEAAAAFLKYVTAPDTGEKYIAENTGYIPVTTKGFELLKSEGFYAGPETCRPRSRDRVADRLGSRRRCRAASGSATSPRSAPKSAPSWKPPSPARRTSRPHSTPPSNARNQILRRYEQTYKGAALP